MTEIRIEDVTVRRRDFLPLLLLGDEQEDMIARYLDRCSLFALYDGTALCTVCAVTDEGSGVFEIKNLATAPEYQRKGYGAAMLRFAADRYRQRGAAALIVGTGDSPLTVPFYRRCGFRYSHRVAGFFTDNYDHPIIEEGVQLRDMLYFRLPLKGDTYEI